MQIIKIKVINQRPNNINLLYANYKNNLYIQVQHHLDNPSFPIVHTSHQILKDIIYKNQTIKTSYAKGGQFQKNFTKELNEYFLLFKRKDMAERNDPYVTNVHNK